MNYYHADENRQAVGPCDADQMQRLYQQGVLHDNSWVIEEGSTQWIPFAQMFPPSSGQGREQNGIKRCGNCGAEIAKDAQFCGECGTKLAVAAATGNSALKSPCVAPVISAPPVQLAAGKSCCGYGGWIAFFCALLIYVGPILTLLRVVRSVFMNLSRTRVYDSTPMALLENVGYFGVSIFGLSAGIMLRRMKPGAVRTAKLYLAVLLLWSCVSVWLPYFDNGIMEKLPPRYRTNVVFDQMLSFCITLAYFAAWMCFLSFSKRVKATYVETNLPDTKTTGAS